MKRMAQETREFVQGAADFMLSNPTEAERAMWDILKPLGFWAQWPIFGATKNGGRWQYVLDFYHMDLNLCVEVDGGIHKRQKGRDRRRDTRLKGEGIRTFRWTNREVLRDPEVVEQSNYSHHGGGV